MPPHQSALTDLDIFYLEQHAALKVHSDRLRLQAEHDRVFRDMECQLDFEKLASADPGTTAAANAVQAVTIRSSIQSDAGAVAAVARRLAFRC
ncbi:hypothetical protein HDU83_009097 [Entophlyctis luteolus]|nr:hypothetical protein HDU83_009097 [Entophlyctis luteolus]